MYRLRFYENGQFCTELGGPIPTLPMATQQMRRIARPIGAVEMSDIIGLQWMRSGVTPCAIAVVDDFGQFITNKDQEDI